MYTFHPLADLFPPMTEAQFLELQEGIKTVGQLHPVILFDGMILDGRNRYRALEALGKLDDLKVIDYTDVSDIDAETWVIETNLNRRSLTPAQKAAAAARQYDPEDAKRASANNANKNDGPKGSPFSITALAARWQCKKENITIAYRLRQLDSAFFDSMFRGEVDMTQANERFASLDKEAKSKAEAKVKAEQAVKDAERKSIQDEARKAADAEMKALRAETQKQVAEAQKAEKEAQKAAEAQRKAAEVERAKLEAQQAKDMAAFEAKVREDAANNGVNLEDLSPENKAKLMTIIANDPEKADSFFEAQKESQRRRNEKAAQDAAEKTRKAAEAAEKKASREAAEAARQDYEASALYHFLKNIIPAAHEGNALLSNKGLSLDHVLVSGHSPDELVKFTESLEDIADNFRQIILKVVDEIKQ